MSSVVPVRRTRGEGSRQAPRRAGARDRQHALARLLDALSASLTPEEAAHVAVTECLSLIGAVRGSVALWDDESGLLEVVEPTGYPESGPPYLTYAPDDPSPVSVAFRTGEPWFADSREAYAEEFPEYGSASTHTGPAAVIPLVIPGGGVIGTLNVGLAPGTDRAAALPLLQEFARVVAQACDRARLFASERRARVMADGIVRVSSALSAAPTLHDVARVVVEEGRRALSAPSSFLVRLNEAGDGLDLVHAAGFPSAVTDEWATIPLATVVPLTEVVRTGEPVWLETVKQANERYPAGTAARESSGYLGALVAPLLVEGRAIGAVSFNFPGERHFTRFERNLTVALASLAAHAFERADLFERVERSRRMIETVVEHMPVGVTIAEAPSGRIIYQNERVATIWGGVKPLVDSIEGYRQWPAVNSDGHELEADEYPIVRALRGKPVTGEQLMIRRPDGTSGFVLANTSPICDSTGTPIAAVSVIIDVTERVQSEALREAFMGLLSHELRTPVTAILGGAKLLASERANLDADTRRELIADVEIEAERLHRLVENVLVIARAERGIQFEEGEPLLLQHLVPQIVRLEQRRWPDAQLEVAVAPNLPAVLGHGDYLGQIVSNLISNAVKYSPTQPEVLIDVRREGDEVAVRVLDRGVGIPGEDNAQLFEAFYRSPETASKAAGAGIGLFVVRQLVEVMHGRVWAAPRPDGGSEFGFALPVLRE